MEFLGKTLDTFNLRDIEKSVKALARDGVPRARLYIYETDASGKAKISRIFEFYTGEILIKSGRFIAAFRRKLLVLAEEGKAEYSSMEAAPREDRIQ